LCPPISASHLENQHLNSKAVYELPLKNTVENILRSFLSKNYTQHYIYHSSPLKQEHQDFTSWFTHFMFFQLLSVTSTSQENRTEVPKMDALLALLENKIQREIEIATSYG